MEDFTKSFSGKLPNGFRLILDEDCFYLIYQGKQVKVFYNIGTSVKEIEKAAREYLEVTNCKKEL